MATLRRSVVLVVLGVLLSTGGAAYYFFFVFSRNEQLREAQAQVLAWEERWVAARACLIGTTPLAADLGDALIAHELDGTEAARRNCSRVVGRLVRPEGNQSGIDAVEVAWEQVEETATSVATSYVAHRNAPLKGKDQALIEALVRLRKARGTLRRQVELTMEDGLMGPAVAELALQPLQLEGQPLTALAALQRGKQLVGRAAVGDRWFTLRATPSRGTAATSLEGRATSRDVVRAAPDGAWGASAALAARPARDPQVLVRDLSIGEIDETGELLHGTVVATSPSLLVGATLDSSAARAVLYVDGEQVMAALSKDRGASWQKSQLAVATDRLIFGDGTGVVDLVWRAPADDATVHWQRIHAAELPALGTPVALPQASLVQFASAPAAPWVLARRGEELMLVRLDRPQATIPVGDATMTEILSCDDDAVLLADAERDVVMACRQGQCGELRQRAKGSVAAVVAGAPMLAVSHRTLLGIYAPGAAPRFLRLPTGLTLYAMYEVDGAPYLVLQRTSGELFGASVSR